MDESGESCVWGGSRGGAETAVGGNLIMEMCETRMALDSELNVRFRGHKEVLLVEDGERRIP